MANQKSVLLKLYRFVGAENHLKLAILFQLCMHTCLYGRRLQKREPLFYHFTYLAYLYVTLTGCYQIPDVVYLPAKCV